MGGLKTRGHEGQRGMWAHLVDFGPILRFFRMVRQRQHEHTASRSPQTLPACLPTLETTFLHVASILSKNYGRGSSKTDWGDRKTRGHEGQRRDVDPNVVEFGPF